MKFYTINSLVETLSQHNPDLTEIHVIFKCDTVERSGPFGTVHFPILLVQIPNEPTISLSEFEEIFGDTYITLSVGKRNPKLKAAYGILTIYPQDVQEADGVEFFNREFSTAGPKTAKAAKDVWTEFSTAQNIKPAEEKEVF